MLEWDHKYDIGHGRIDAEHRIFLSLIADFQQAVLLQASNAKQYRILAEIISYAAFHFISEENIMIDCDYPERERHSSLHNLLLAEIKHKCAQFKHGEINGEEVFEFLFHWFVLHTTHEDKKLADFSGTANT